MHRSDLCRAVRLAQGSYDVTHGGQSLVRLMLPKDDDDVGRAVPRVEVPDSDKRQRVLAALIRAGCRHPGLAHRDLARLHALAQEHRHVELFADVNAICTGLLGQVARSLGPRLARVVVASSTVDVLQEYADLNHTRGPTYIRHGEVARSISLLDELRRLVPVHVHQLPPGAALHQRRQHEDDLVLLEDRVMIAAYWDYRQRDLPRLPVVFLTSDHALAQACAMEQVLFCFAHSPQEFVLRAPPGALAIDALWLDPASLALRYALTSDILFELATTFRDVQWSDAKGAGWRVAFDPRNVWPGAELSVEYGPIPPPPAAATPTAATSATTPGRLDVAITSVLAVVPTEVGLTTQLDAAGINDKAALRQLQRIGEETELFSVADDVVSPGASLPSLLQALRDCDYDVVHAIFSRVPSYQGYLDRADPTTGRLPADPNSRAPGWAVTLGAAYKFDGGLLYGLTVVDDSTFADAVRDAHAELAAGADASSLPLVIDKVCHVLRMSPVRVIAQLNRCLAPGEALHAFDVQRAKRDEAVPKKHPIIMAPDQGQKFIRDLQLGRGVELQGRLSGTLVTQRKDAQ